MHIHKQHIVRNTLIVLTSFVGGIVTTLLAAGISNNATLTPDQYAANMIVQLATSITEQDATKKLAIYQAKLADIPYYIETLQIFQTKLSAAIKDIQVINNNTVVDPAKDLVYTAGSPAHTDYVNSNTNSSTNTAVNPTGQVVTTGDTTTNNTCPTGSNTVAAKGTLRCEGTTQMICENRIWKSTGVQCGGDTTVNTNNDQASNVTTGPTTQGGTSTAGTTTTLGQNRTVTTQESCNIMNKSACDIAKGNSAYKYIKISNGNKQYFTSITDCFDYEYHYMSTTSATSWKGSFPSVEQPQDYICIPGTSTTVKDPDVISCKAGTVNFSTTSGNQTKNCIGSVATSGTVGETKDVTVTQGTGKAKVTCTTTGWVVATDAVSTSCTTAGSAQVNNTSNNTVAGSCSPRSVEFFTITQTNGGTTRKNCVATVSDSGRQGAVINNIRATQGSGSVNVLCGTDNMWVPTAATCTVDKSATTGTTGNPTNPTGNLTGTNPSQASATLSVMGLGYGGANSPWGYEGYEPITEGRPVEVIYDVANVKTCTANYTEIDGTRAGGVSFPNQGGSSNIIGPWGSAHGTFLVPGIKMRLVMTCIPLVGSTPATYSIDFKQTKPDPGDTLTINLKTKNGVATTEPLSVKQGDTIVFDYAFGDNYIQCDSNQQVYHQNGVGNFLFSSAPNSGYPNRNGTATWTVGNLSSSTGSLKITCIRSIDRQSREKSINVSFVVTQASAGASQGIAYANIGGGSVDDCNAKIINKFGSTQKYWCTEGGGCTPNSQKPANKNESANPTGFGACIPQSEWDSVVATVNQQASQPSVPVFDQATVNNFVQGILTDTENKYNGDITQKFNVIADTVRHFVGQGYERDNLIRQVTIALADALGNNYTRPSEAGYKTLDELVAGVKAYIYP